jgi:hypothetical protein
MLHLFPAPRPHPAARALSLAATIALLAAAPLAAPLATTLAAQSVRGTVLADESGSPIELVELWLALNGAPIGTVVRSDDQGRFLIDAPRAGRFSIRTRRLGYEPLASIEFDVAPGTELQVEVRLTRAAQPLGDTVRVSAERGPGMLLAGFEDRRRVGLGTFFTRTDIEARGEPRLIDLVRTVSWITIPSAQSERLGNVRNGLVRRCATVVFLDGVRLNRAEDSPDYVVSLLETMRGSSLEAVELYRGRSDLPAEFGGPEVRCGAIVVWTRNPDYRKKEKKAKKEKEGERSP